TLRRGASKPRWENSSQPSPICSPCHVLICEGDQRGEQPTRSKATVSELVPRTKPWRCGPRCLTWANRGGRRRGSTGFEDLDFLPQHDDARGSRPRFHPRAGLSPVDGLRVSAVSYDPMRDKDHRQPMGLAVNPTAMAPDHGLSEWFGDGP